MKKIIITNIFIFFIFVLILEFGFMCHKFYLRYRKISRLYDYGKIEKIKKATKSVIELYEINEKYFDKNTFREPILTNKTTKGIILLGCSFTYGEKLNEDETLGYKLFEYTGENIYNLGIQGGSPREMLYLFQNTDLLNKYINNNKDINMVLYLFIDDHLRRLYTETRNKDPIFKLTKENKLKYTKPKFHSEAYIYIVSDNMTYIIPVVNQFKLFNQYMIELNNEIKKQFGEKTKFVILVYDERKKKNNWDILKNEGIIVINVKDISDKDFASEEYLSKMDNYHPSALVWEEIVPKLTDILKQKNILAGNDINE